MFEYTLTSFTPTTTVATGNRVIMEIYTNNTNASPRTLTYSWGNSTTPTHMHTSISIAIVGPTGAQGLGGALGNYGSFLNYNLTAQSFNDTPEAFILNTTVENNGVHIGNPSSRIVIDNAGTYNFQFSAQIYQNIGNRMNAIIWYRVNGVDALQSATDIYLENGQYNVASWNFVQTMQAGQYFELMGAAREPNTTFDVVSMAITDCP